MLDGELDIEAIDNVSPARLQAMTDGMAVRTKYFDDYFINATGTGVRQAVILASGLDARAYRLPWPDGTMVYELDQPQVIEFKTTTLAGIGAEPTATRRTVPIDLRQDWPAALKAAGLDTAAPTAWLAEGLLIYLPPEAQDRLFDNITALSVPGSTIATEFVPGIVDFDAERAREMSGAFREHGVDVDMASLVYTGERNHVVDYLRAKGWDVEGIERTELFKRHGIDVPDPNSTTRSAKSSSSAAGSPAKSATPPATTRAYRSASARRSARSRQPNGRAVRPARPAATPPPVATTHGVARSPAARSPGS